MSCFKVHFPPLLCSFSVASLVAQAVKNLPAVWEPRFDAGVGKIPRRRKRQLTPVFLSEEFQGQGSLVGYSPQRVRHDRAANTLDQQHWHLLTVCEKCIILRTSPVVQWLRLCRLLIGVAPPVQHGF